MLRRREFFTPDELTFSTLRLNRSTYELIDKNLSLSAKEFKIMEMLMQRPKMIITTEQIITHFSSRL